MKSISAKIEHTLIILLMSVMAIFTIMSIVFFGCQTLRITSVNDSAGKSLADFSDNVLRENMKNYVMDLRLFCGKIIEDNFTDYSNIGKAAGSLRRKPL